MYKWYPVYTYPRAEKKAYERLVSKGIEAYLPLQRQLREWSDRRRWIEEPLIKSYLFVKILAKQSIDVLNTQGIARFIYFSGKIASIPEIQIEALKVLLAETIEFEVSDRFFKKGEQAKVISGPLIGLSGELVEVYSKKQFLIRLGDTEKSLLVKIPIAVLELQPLQ